MPLNKEKGEVIGNLGTDYVLAPLDRWANSGLFTEALKHAVDAFVSAGAILPCIVEPDDVLVQEYPRQNKVAFLFQRRIAGAEHFYPYVFDLPPQMISKLAASGKWGHRH